jgi:transposase
LTIKLLLVICIATMYIDTSKSVQRGKTYYRHLLRESYREDGKIKHRTLANFSSIPDRVITAMKLALKHKEDLSVLVNVTNIETAQGMRIGAVFCLQAVAVRLGLVKALGADRQGKLAFWQVLARLIDQGSRLSAVRLAERHGICDILGLDTFHEDHLYANLSWLSENQEVIEKRLFKQRYGTAPPKLFLYDVTSSYLEGTCNAFGAFGYNRDGKKGKQQIVVGLLADSEGVPVSVRVFEGNTQDVKTVGDQVSALVKRFGVEEVIFVGDRGMLKQPQLNLLEDHRFHYITAITKAQIRKLLKDGVFQMELFDDDIGEIEYEDIRYVFRRNPQRAEEISKNRGDKLKNLERLLDQKNAYLAGHGRSKTEIAARKVVAYARKLKLQDWIEVDVDGRRLTLRFNRQACDEASRLDGCYVIKTDLPTGDAPAGMIHDRYKDLAQVEWAFRTFKQGHLEIHPTFVQTKASTQGHVFVIMLAYLLERELYRCWQNLDITVAEGIDELGSLRGVEITIGDVKCQKVPRPVGLSEKLLQAAGVRLPDVLPLRQIHVATRKKLTDGRKTKQHQQFTQKISQN